MKCPLVLVLVLATLTIANPVPPEPTTARYSFGGHSTQTFLPQFSDAVELISTESANGTAVVKISVRDDASRKIKRKDQKLYTNFVKHNLEDLTAPNKTLKITTVNRVKVTTAKPRTRVTPSQVTVNVTKALKLKVTGRPLSTKAPFRIKLTRVTTPPTRYKYKNYTRVRTTRRPGGSYEIKQNWYEEGVPYPNPMPEVSSHSPPYSISDGASLQQLQQPQHEQALADLNNAISTFNLDMASDPGAEDIQGNSRCPSVHISSSVLTPQQRQDCSDLNLVINSHFHQNTVTDRSPVSTYDAQGQPQADDPGAGTAGGEDPGVQADPGGGGAPQAAAPAASPGGGTGGSGGSGGSGGDGDGGGLTFPDLKGLFEALGWLWEKLGHLFRFLKNPYLYIVPMVLFFLLGFLAVILLFPWWIPALFLTLTAKGSQKTSNVAFYKHVHKPVHHPDGWFWNHETKTWQNVADHYRHRRSIDVGRELTNIPQAIENFAKKYRGDSTQSWKWRKR